jgi:hypothetical protein
MSEVSFDVEVIVQEQNPICWIASCAMVKGYGTQTSVGVGEFTNGFDPSTSCIANLAGNWTQCTDLMKDWGFQVYQANELVSGTVTPDLLLDALHQKGPAVLLHLCHGFPYGAQWSGLVPDGAHAVVLTGVDTGRAIATFNNPWGDKDQQCDLSRLLEKINSDAAVTGKTLAFWE